MAPVRSVLIIEIYECSRALSALPAGIRESHCNTEEAGEFIRLACID